MLLIIYKSRKTDSLDGASPSGKAPGFGPGISEVRILPPQNNKRPTFVGLFYYSKFGMETINENRASEQRLK